MLGRRRASPADDLGTPGSASWYADHAYRADARGAGVTGRVILDGIGFQLDGAGQLPKAMTIDPGSAPAAWLQTDPWSVTGYEGDVTGIW